MSPRQRAFRLGVLVVLVCVLAGIWFNNTRAPSPASIPRADAASLSAKADPKAPANSIDWTRSNSAVSPATQPVAPPPHPATLSTPTRIHGKDAIEDRWPDAETLVQSQRIDPATPDLVQRVRILRTDFKYPLVRVEEIVRVDSSTSDETLVAQTAMVADHVLVKLASTADARLLAATVSANGGSIRSVKPASKVYLVTFANPLDLAGLPEAIDSLKSVTGVIAIAEPDFIVHTATTPNDTSFAQLWGLHNTGQTGGTADADIDAPEAWEITTGSRSVVVGVIDTGIDHTHPDLAANMWTNPAEIPGNNVDDDGNGYVDDVRGWDFVNNDANPMDDNRHGTHCAGTIGGAGNNALGVAGVNWQVSLVGLKFLSAGGSGSTSDAVEAVAYANGLPIHLTSNSWGGGGFSQLLYDAIAAANTAGRPFIAAAGNNGRNTDSSPNYPSGYNLPNIIAVAATDHADQLAYFSNYGVTSVDLAAPGVNTLSTAPAADYRTLSGTSMATPHVAGAAALLIAHRPGLTAPDIKSALMASVDVIPAVANKTLSGGRLNAHAALLALDNLLVSPNVGWTGSLPLGGQLPANPAGYTLRNLSAAPRSWSASFNAPWAQLAVSSGTVPANNSATVSLSLVASAVQTLPAGNHTGQLTITDLASGRTHTRQLSLTVTPPAAFTFDLSSDPGWPRTGQWAFGKPAGLGGGSFGGPDPTSGYTGANVFGVNLSGNYSTTPGGPHTVTAGPLNLAGYAATRLQFRRWLNSDYEPFVSATVELSTNGTTWRTLWRNGGGLITESAWSLQDIDLSAYADNQPAVYLRWTYAVTSSSGVWPLSGWNIDDIVVLGAPPQTVRFDPLAAISETAANATATLRLTPAPSSPLDITFTSSSPTSVSAPTQITVPAGATSAVVPLAIIDNTLLDGTRTVSITPAAVGYSPAPLLVTIHDNESATLSLDLPSTATEGATATGRVLISDAPSAPISVSLTSTLADAATVPSSVVVPAGATSADFTLTFPDNTRIEGSREATVTASVSGWTSGQASVTVADNDARTLALTFIPGFAEGRGTVEAAGTVTLTGTLTSPFTVTLTSSAPDQLSVPATVVVPAGARTVRFAVTLPDDDQQDGVQTVTVTASAATFTDAETTVPVADNDPASFAFDTIPSPQYVGQAFSARITALDINGAPAAGYTGLATLSGKIAAAPTSLLPAQTTAFTAGTWTGALTALEAGDGWTVQAAAGASTGASSAFTVRVPVTQIVNLANNDIVYDPDTNRIYASTPSGTLVPINPTTGTLDPAIPVATTATTLLARAPDGSRLWVAHDGGKQIIQVALPSATPGASFGLGTGSYGTTLAEDLVALPGSPDSLVVSRYRAGVSPRHDGVAVYDNGVKRATTTQDHTGSNSIEAGATPNRIFGYNNETSEFGSRRLQASPAGLAQLDVRDDLIGGYGVTIHADGDLVAATNGRVIDNETYRVLASLPYSGVIRPDNGSNRVYVLSDQGGGLRRLRAYDTTRFTEVGTIDVSGVSGNPSGLIRWGSGGLAFRTPTQIFLLNTALVPTADSANLQVTQLASPANASVGQPLNYLVSVRNLGGGPAASVVLTDVLPTNSTLVEAIASQGSVTKSSGQVTASFGTLAAGAEATLRLQITPSTAGSALNNATVVSSTGDPDTSNNVSSSTTLVSTPPSLALRRSAFGARDLAYDFASDRLLVTVGNTAPSFANTLLRLAPGSLAVHSADFLGNNPGRVKLTADGQYVYAILDGSFGLARAPVVQNTSIPLNFPVSPAGSPYGLLSAVDITPITGRPDALAVARNLSSGTVAIYENGQALPVTTPYHNGTAALTDSPDAQKFYGSSSSAFYKYNALADGVAIEATANSFYDFGGTRIKRAGSFVYITGGRVIDLEQLALVANLSVSGPIEPSLDDQAFYILDGSTLRAYDLVTREPVGTLALGTLDGTPTNLVRAGGRSLAFTTTTGQLYVLDAPSFVPAPALRVVLPARITEGVGTAPGVGRVEIHRPAATDIAIQLNSSGPEVLDITRNILLPAGQTSVAFDITVTDNAGLNGTRSVTVTASTEADYTPKPATILVDDDETATLSLTLPASINESDTGALGTVALSGPASVPITVALASSDVTEASVPATVVIPAGSTSATFSLVAVNDDLMDGSQSTTITAAVPNYTAGTATVQVTDDEGRVLTLSLPATLNEGNYYTSVTLSLSGKTVTSLAVSISSSDTTELTTPATYTIPIGVSSVSFNLGIPDDTLLDGAQPVTVTVTAPGFTTATATTSVHDNDPASGTWSAITGPKTAGTAFSASLTLKTIDDLPASGFSDYVTVTATNAAGPATLLNSPVTLYVSGGVGSGSFAIVTAGEDTRLHAQVASLAPIQSDAFTVTSGNATRFVVAPLPSSQFVGQPAAVTITAQDNHGNTSSAYTGIAALAAGPPPVFTGTGNANTQPYPLYSYNTRTSRTQIVYTPAEIGGAGPLASIALDIATLPGKTLQNWTIRLKHLPSATVSGWESTGWTTVYQGALDPANSTVGWNGFPFTVPFDYDGTSHLLVDFSYNNDVVSNASNGAVKTTYSSSSSRVRYANSSSSTSGDPLLWTGATPSSIAGFYLPNLRISRAGVVPVTPATTSAFTAGTWTGPVNFGAPSEGAITLQASQGYLFGESTAFTVHPSSVIGVTPETTFTLSGPRGGDFTGHARDYTLTNIGEESISWTAATVAWLSLTPAEGTLAPGATATLTARPTTAASALPSGVHRSEIVFAVGDATHAVRPVELTATPSGTLAVFPATGFAPNGLAGGPFTPATAVWTLTNTGDAPLAWSAAKSSTWAALSATEGTLAPGASATVTASLDATATTLPVGTYNDTITFTTGINGQGNTTRPAFLTVRPPAPPVVILPPAPVSVIPGDNATLQVTTTSDATPTYQWYRGASGDTAAPVPGATAATLVTPPLYTNASFWVRISSAAGFTNSGAAPVTILPVRSLNLLSTGYNLNGELGDGTTVNRLTPLQIADKVAHASFGNGFAAFLKADGTLWTMGLNTYGQLGDGTTTQRATPVQAASAVRQVAAGHYHTVFLKTDSTLWGIGTNASKQLGGTAGQPVLSPAQIASDVVQASAGSGHTHFLKSDGSLWGLGANSYGQLGDGTTTSRSVPVLIATGVARVSAGANHTLFLKTNGTVWSMGYNFAGQLGDGSKLNRSTPVQAASGVTQISAGAYHSAFIKANGTLWTMGDNSSGKLGNGSNYSQSTPVQVATGAVRLAAGHTHTFFTKADLTLWAMGSNFRGGFGDGTTTDRWTPWKVNTAVVDAAAGSSSSLFLSNTPGFITQPASVSILTGQTATLSVTASGPGDLSYQWYQGASGTTTSPVAGATGSIFTTQPLTATTPYWVRVTSAFGSTNSITATVTVNVPPTLLTPPVGTAVLRGRNAVLSVSASGGALAYQWYRGSSGNTAQPVPGATGDTVVIQPLVTTTQFWVRISNIAGTINSPHATVSVIPAAFNLKAMGSNTHGQLGNGVVSTEPTSVPQSVTGNVAQIAAGAAFSLILKSDGTLWSTGSNTAGQLGDGTTTNRSTPVQIASGVAQIAAGSGHAFFIKNNGTLWATGSNTYGQLGDGTTTRRLTPVQIATGVVQVAAGSSHTLFLKTDGTLWSCGYNNRGQLGDGTTADRATPAQIATGVAAIAAGSNQTYFIKADATLWAAGENFNGQLGDGTITRRTVPVQVLTNVAQVATQYCFSQFLKTDGTLWAVGANWQGQLGDGTTQDRYLPIQVATDVAHVATGDRFTAFVQTDARLRTVGQNTSGQLGDHTVIGRHFPVTVAPGVAFVATGDNHTLFLQVPPPAITRQPGSLTIARDQSTTLSVTATGSGPLSYQWYRGTTGDTSLPIAGATSASFTTTALTTTTRYWVRVTRFTFTDSATAVVTVLPPAPALLPEPPITGGAGNTVAWSPVGNVTAYEVQAATTADFAHPLTSGWQTALTHTFPSLTDGLTWHFRVRNRVVTYSNNAWQQSSAAEFATGVGTSIDTSNHSGDVVLSSAGVNLHETFDDAPTWSATRFPDVSAGLFELTTLASEQGPATNPPLPINQDGDTEARLNGNTANALTQDSFTDGFIDAYLAPANLNNLHYGALLLRASRNEGLLNAYGAVLLFFADGSVKADFSRIINGSINGMTNWFYSDTSSFALAANENIRARFSIQGSTLTLQLWRVAVSNGVITETPIPFNKGSNTLTATDATHTAAGRAGLYAYTSNTFGTRTLFDDVTVASSPTAYAPSGTFVSPTITPSALIGWGRLDYTAERPSGTSLAIDVVNAAGDTVLAENLPAGTDLATLPALAGQTALHLRARLATSQTSVTPRLSDWKVSWNSTIDTIATSPWSSHVSSIQDATAPTLALTSPTLVFNPNYTFVGTAFDANGLGSLAINGQPAPSDSSWTQPFTLTLGDNVFTVVAADNATPANTTTRQFTVTYAYPTDTDTDGMPDDWETAHDLDSTSSTGIHGPRGDPDGDGLPNLLEYAFNTDPRLADPRQPYSARVETDADTGATDLIFTYPRLLLPGPLTYDLLTSADLKAWTPPVLTPADITTNANADGVTETVTVRLPLNSGRRFVRISVTLP